MPRIEFVQTSQLIDCQTENNGVAILRRTDSYLLSPSPDELSYKNGKKYITLDPDTILELSSLVEDDEIYLQFSEAVGFFSNQRSVPIYFEEMVDSQGIQLSSKLNFEYLEHLLEKSPEIKFPFSIVVWRHINLSELRDLGLISERCSSNVQGRSLFIQSQLRSNNLEGTPIVLRNYPRTIGDLRDEVIRKVVMFSGARSESWKITIDRIEQAFTTDTYSNAISQALREQTNPFLTRIPAFLHRLYHWNGSSPLEVIVTIPEVEINKEYQIDVHLYNPAEELFHPSGIPIVDSCLRNIHIQLLENGIPVGPETEIYQLLLRQLLSYRYHCAHTPEYINHSIVSQSEISGFHRHLHSKLANQVDTVTLEVVNEQQLGNSRVDMMIVGYPVELKLEDRRTADTEDIIRRYEGQAADYVARQGSPFGFLLVLDTVLDRDLPTASLEQDLRFRQVLTSSGQSVVVIAIVIRIPRPASDHTALRA